MTPGGRLSTEEGKEATLDALGLFNWVVGTTKSAETFMGRELEVLLSSWLADTEGGDPAAAACCFRGTLDIMVGVLLVSVLTGFDEFDIELERSGFWVKAPS